MRKLIRHMAVRSPAGGGPYIWTEEDGLRHFDSGGMPLYTVILNGEQIEPFEVEEYSDGLLRAHCHVKRDGRFVLVDDRIQTEWREGTGSVTEKP